MTAWGRSRRAALGLGSGMALLGMAACSSPPAKIPAATPTPSSAPTSIAPGVSVSPAELALPPYSVSISNPLPAGVSATRVVRDFVADDLIENLAIERGDANLLPYADSGGMLTIDESTIGAERSTKTRFISIEDSVERLAVGRQQDPNDPLAVVALNVEGVERTTTRDARGAEAHKVVDFHVIIWMIWSPPLQKYLRCDVSVL